MNKEKSYMLAIPTNEEDVKDLDKILYRLENTKDFEVLISGMENEKVKINIKYKGNSYNAEFYPIDQFKVDSFYRITHSFSDFEFEEINRKELGIVVEMYFGEKSVDSYHLQLKLINAILPNTLGVIDYGAEKILSGKWVSIAAKSNTPPAPKYIYTVQAVSDENEVIWLHTHGLNRCGITELEVLNSTKEGYSNHYSIIEAMASRLLESDLEFKEKESMYLARLSEDIHLVTTIISWEEALNLYSKDIVGGKPDRERGHNQNTSAIFTYASDEECEKGIYRPIYIYDNILKNNPLYMLSLSETNRMKSLAIERIEYVDKAFKNEKNIILLKIALEIDEEYKTDNNFHEHIWFELKDLDIYKDSFIAELTQDPYYISDMKKGDIGRYRLKNITDWLIIMPECRVSPDDVYLLDKK